MFTYFNGYLFRKCAFTLISKIRGKERKLVQNRVLFNFFSQQKLLELSKESETLMTAEFLFKFLFKKLLAALKRQFNERRKKGAMTLMAYLLTGKMLLGDDDLTYCSKTARMSFTKKFVSHNFAAQPATQNLDISSASEDSVEEDLAAVLQKSISNIFTGKSVKRTNNFTELQKEFKLFEACDTKTKKLEKITSALQTIQPTSTSSERTFSIAGGSPQRSEIPCSINCFAHWYS
jgi:hypothetical protein